MLPDMDKLSPLWIETYSWHIHWVYYLGLINVTHYFKLPTVSRFQLWISISSCYFFPKSTGSLWRPPKCRTRKGAWSAAWGGTPTMATSTCVVPCLAECSSCSGTNHSTSSCCSRYGSYVLLFNKNPFAIVCIEYKWWFDNLYRIKCFFKQDGELYGFVTISPCRVCAIMESHEILNCFSRLEKSWPWKKPKVMESPVEFCFQLRKKWKPTSAFIYCVFAADTWSK